jgi:hypothetical protein
VAAVVAARHAGFRPGIWAAVAFGAAIAILVAGPADWTRLRPSEYKELCRRSPWTARVVAQRSSPLGLLTVVEPARAVPLRARREPLARTSRRRSSACSPTATR